LKDGLKITCSLEVLEGTGTQVSLKKSIDSKPGFTTGCCGNPRLTESSVSRKIRPCIGSQN
jgi:hypothetical protein